MQLYQLKIPAERIYARQSSDCTVPAGGDFSLAPGKTKRIDGELSTFKFKIEDVTLSCQSERPSVNSNEPSLTYRAIRHFQWVPLDMNIAGTIWETLRNKRAAERHLEGRTPTLEDSASSKSPTAASRSSGLTVNVQALVDEFSAKKTPALTDRPRNRYGKRGSPNLGVRNSNNSAGVQTVLSSRRLQQVSICVQGLSLSGTGIIRLFESLSELWLIIKNVPFGGILEYHVTSLRMKSLSSTRSGRLLSVDDLTLILECYPTAPEIISLVEHYAIACSEPATENVLVRANTVAEAVPVAVVETKCRPNMSPADEFMLRWLMNSPQSKDCLIFCLGRTKVELDLRRQLGLLMDVAECAECILDATEVGGCLAALFEVILKIGNTINQSFGKPEVTGFRIESVLLLKDYKSENRTLSLLGLLAKSFSVDEHSAMLQQMVGLAVLCKRAADIECDTVMLDIGIIIKEIHQLKSALEDASLRLNNKSNSSSIPVLYYLMISNVPVAEEKQIFGMTQDFINWSIEIINRLKRFHHIVTSQLSLALRVLGETDPKAPKKLLRALGTFLTDLSLAVNPKLAKDLDYKQQYTRKHKNEESMQMDDIIPPFPPIETPTTTVPNSATMNTVEAVLGRKLAEYDNNTARQQRISKMNDLQLKNQQQQIDTSGEDAEEMKRKREIFRSLFTGGVPSLKKHDKLTIPNQESCMPSSPQSEAPPAHKTLQDELATPIEVKRELHPVHLDEQYMSTANSQGESNNHYLLHRYDTAISLPEWAYDPLPNAKQRHQKELLQAQVYVNNERERLFGTKYTNSIKEITPSLGLVLSSVSHVAVGLWFVQSFKSTYRANLFLSGMENFISTNNDQQKELEYATPSSSHAFHSPLYKSFLRKYSSRYYWDAEPPPPTTMTKTLRCPLCSTKLADWTLPHLGPLQCHSPSSREDHTANPFPPQRTFSQPNMEDLRASPKFGLYFTQLRAVMHHKYVQTSPPRLRSWSREWQRHESPSPRCQPLGCLYPSARRSLSRLLSFGDF